ncbi:Uncharacterised protein [Mycobacteroides abscessus subsp. abscessus]|nr:Uncharacterised protein [Mycobacteroides abscessus subsp. abscessus]
MEGALDGDQRRFALGEGAVVGLVAAAELGVDALGGETVEPLDGGDEGVGGHADLRGEFGQGVGGVPEPRLDVWP